MSRTLQPDDRLSHYRVVGPLGAGGMGEVYAARDEKLDRSVALKILPPRLVRNEERVRRFVTEARSASSLNHPNIVTIYDIDQAEVRASQAGDEPAAPVAPVHFISMELVNGTTLSHQIHTERADLRTLLGYLAQAAEGIAKAHAAGIVHRDLKPGNIMVTQDGFAKVLDFGLAKLTEKREADPDLTSAPTEGAVTGEGVVMGTVGYMSPEQVQGRGVDHRTDIFSMGCILYEAATRRRPFMADTDVEVMHQILRDTPAPVEQHNPAVPADVRRIIRRCLAKSPDQRFQSMKDLAIDLREVVELYDSLSATASSGSSPATGSLHATPRRSGMAAAIAVSAVIGIAGIAFGLYGFMNRGDRGQTETSASLDIDVSVLMSQDNLNEAVLSADGRFLAYVVRASGNSSLRVRQVRTGGDVVILPEQKFDLAGISFSPDGDYLYYLDRDTELPNYRALFEVPSLGGTPRKVFFDVDSPATFSSDGRTVCFRRGKPDRGVDTLVVGSLDTGDERELLRIQDPESFRSAPAWSPDGETIAVAILAPSEGRKVFLVAVDVETAERNAIGTTWLEVDSLGWLANSDAILLAAREFDRGTSSQVYRISYPGGQVTRMTNDLDGYSNLSVSADGSSAAAVRRSDRMSLWVVPADAQAEPRPLTVASGAAGSVEWFEPLRGAVVYTSSGGAGDSLMRIGADGSGQRPLTSGQVVVADHAVGAGVVFVGVDQENRTIHIWRVSPDGSDLRPVVEKETAWLTSLAPTGNALIFTKPASAMPNSLYVQKLDGTDPYPLMEAANIVSASIAPDGLRVLVTTLEGEEREVFPRRYIVPIEGGEPLASFTLSPGVSDVRWSPDGTSLTYVDRNKGWNLMRVRIPDGEPEPLTYFEKGQIRDYHWQPGTGRLLLVRLIDKWQSLWTKDPDQAEPVRIREFRNGIVAEARWAPDEPLIYFTHGNRSSDVVLIRGIQ